MSSSGDIVKRALKRLGIVAPGEDVDAADAQDGNAALNAMIASWQNDGVDVSPDVPIASKHEEAIVAMLAVRLAGDYGKTPSALLMQQADRGWDSLRADYLRVPSAQFDGALINGTTHAGLVLEYYLIRQWRPQTAYVVGDTVQFSGRVYECTTAGTSGGVAGSGPTGRTTATDGTVVWTFVRVV